MCRLDYLKHHYSKNDFKRMSGNNASDLLKTVDISKNFDTFELIKPGRQSWNMKVNTSFLRTNFIFFIKYLNNEILNKKESTGFANLDNFYIRDLEGSQLVEYSVLLILMFIKAISIEEVEDMCTIVINSDVLDKETHYDGTSDKISCNHQAQYGKYEKFTIHPEMNILDVLYQVQKLKFGLHVDVAIDGIGDSDFVYVFLAGYTNTIPNIPLIDRLSKEQEIKLNFIHSIIVKKYIHSIQNSLKFIDGSRSKSHNLTLKTLTSFPVNISIILIKDEFGKNDYSSSTCGCNSCDSCGSDTTWTGAICEDCVSSWQCDNGCVWG